MVVQNRDTTVILDCAVRKLSSLRSDLVVELLPLIDRIASDCTPQVTPAAVARLIDRYRMLMRFAELRRGDPDASERKLIDQVLREERNARPDIRASQSSIRRWQRMWNDRTPDGLARALVGLLDTQGRRTKPTSN